MNRFSQPQKRNSCAGLFTSSETQGLLSLFEGQKSPWELTLTEPVPEIFEFVPLIGQSAKRSSRGTLSPSYTMWFSSSIGVYHRKILVESFRKRCNEAEEIANRNMGARKQYSSINFHGELTEGISLILITNEHDFYTVVFSGAQTLSNTHRFLLFLLDR